jgi:hypothetical protein
MKCDEVDDRSVVRSEDTVREIAESSTYDETESHGYAVRAGVSDHHDQNCDYDYGDRANDRSPSLRQAEAAAGVVLELQIELPKDVDVASREPVYGPGFGELIDGKNAGGDGSGDDETGLRSVLARRRLA